MYKRQYLNYGYKSTGLAQELTKVTSVQEYAADGTAGNSMSVTYNRDKTTKFSYVKSGMTTTETHTFDNFGRTISIINADGNATTGSYTSTPGKQNNRLTHQAEGAKYVNNLLLDTSAEKSTSKWTGVNGGTPAATFTRDTSQQYLGSYSLKVSQSSATSNNHGYYQSVSLSANTTYTLSAYMKTSSVAGGGASIWVQFYNANGTNVGVTASPLSLIHILKCNSVIAFCASFKGLLFCCSQKIRTCCFFIWCVMSAF